MRKLRLYVARRDARKAARMKQTVLSKKDASSSSQAADAKPKTKNEKNKDVGIFGVNGEEQTRMNLLSLRDWRRSAMEQRAGAEVIKELDEVIQLQEEKLKKMDGRKAAAKRPGSAYAGSDDMETDTWEEVTEMSAEGESQLKAPQGWAKMTKNLIDRDCGREANIKRSIKEVRRVMGMRK